MRKAFTLLELLVVVAIMGMLGVAASGAYSSLVRGMEERGAVAAASGILTAAKERAQVERVPTAVFCYNRLLKEPSKVNDENGLVVGVMVAVRRAGRLTDVQGDSLFDEFADLDVTYETTEDASDLGGDKASGMRLYRFGSENMKMQYSVVGDQILKSTRPLTVFSGTAQNGATNVMMSAFYNLNKSDREPDGWEVGSAYAFEFAEFQLPEGYIFGTEVPSKAGTISEPKVLYFDPESDAEKTIDVYPTQPDTMGWPKTRSKKAGQATSDNKKGM